LVVLQGAYQAATAGVASAEKFANYSHNGRVLKNR
jgi:hypothetical protein